jgi:DNA polymerase-3 subunit alpha
VATDDSHYVLKEDASDQRVVLCTNMNTTLREIHQKIINEEDVGLGNFFKYDHYYLHSYDEMRALGHTEEELTNTLKIADMCEHYNIKQKPKLPKFPVPNGSPSEEYLKDLCRKGWATLKPKLKKAMERKGVSQQVYVDRFNEEFNVLMDEGLADYFLIVEDVIRFARSRGQLTGVARGSSGGSLILYLLGVTKIDPIYYDLLFARFFNSARNVPDHVSFEESPFLKFIGV